MLALYTLKQFMTSFYATTYFYQNDQEFRCTWDLTATKEDLTIEETIHHLASMFQENYPETWNLDEEGDEDEDEDEDEHEDDEESDLHMHNTLHLHGLSPEEFARELVLRQEQSADRFGVTWEISTRWDEVDPDNWEHPSNT